MDDLTLIATTGTQGLRRVATGGQPVLQSYEQIDRHLRRALGRAHAELFAEPNPGPGGIDWYARVDGPVLPLARAEPPVQEAVRARLGELTGAIAAHAETLGRSAQPGERQMGRMLELALEVPDERSVWCIGERPVLVSWGFQIDEPDPPTGVLRRMALIRPKLPPAAAPVPEPVAKVASPPMPEPPAPPVSEPVERELQTVHRVVAAPADPLTRFLWAILTLLLVAIFILLLLGCGIAVPFTGGRVGLGLLDYCAAPTAYAGGADPLDLERQRERALKDRLAQLQNRLATADASCKARATPAALPPPAEKPAEEMDRRLDRAGAMRGAVNVSLAWDSDADLDLYVACPSGGVLSWNRRTDCGGTLDVDMNRAAPLSRQPVENAAWAEGATPTGTYTVLVHNYDGRSDGARPTKFRLRVVVGGETKTIEGEAAKSERPVPVHQFDIR